MSAPRSSDDSLFPAQSPSAIARAEGSAAGTTEAADARVAAEALARAGEPGSPGAGLRARIAASVGRAGRYGKYADRLARLFDISIDTARDVLTRAEDPASFGPGPLPGTAWIAVEPGPKYAGTLALVGRLDPGARVPDHQHGGEEITLVLDGGFVDEATGEEIWRGEDLHKAPGSEHAFHVIGDEPCIAAILTLGVVTFKDGSTL